MLISLTRTLVLYVVVIIAMRIMGKKQIGELQPSELVITIMISELAAIPMQETGIPLIYGIIPIVTLMSVEVFLSILTLKSRKIRELLSGKPSIILRGGKLDIKEMKRIRFNIEDLFEELRMNKITNLNDVEYALIETNGKLSVIPKPSKQALTPFDMKINTNSAIQFVVINDGLVDINALGEINRDISWLQAKLKENKIKDIKSVFIAMADNKGGFFYQLIGKDGDRA